jgi:hypothetical protein
MRRGLFILAKIAIVLLIVVPAFGLGVFYLWNWLMPQLFGLHAVTYWQALGLVGLSWLLFRGPRIGGWGGWGRGRALRARWAAMTPEQREQFMKGLQGRCGRGMAPPEAAQTGTGS